MLISYLVYVVQTGLTILGNVLRKGLRLPDYVVFTLHGSYPDLRQPPEGFLQKKMRTRVKSLQELEKEFQAVAENPRVKGVILQLSSLPLPLSRVQSLVNMVKNLQAKGKEVIIWSTFYDFRSYFLAAAGDRILMQKGGIIYSLGLAQRQLYIKNALDWLGIELDVVQVSPYKSALERFTRSDMSEEARTMTGWVMDSYYAQFVRAVAQGRNLDEEKVHALIEQPPLFGEKAIDIGAADGVVNAEELPAYLGSEEKPASLAHWDQCGKRFPRPLPGLPGKYIALLRVEGNIVDGKSRRPPARPPLPAPFLFDAQTGDLTFVQQARQALKDKRARAVLLYIDSRGGSASSSEAMTSILKEIAEKKPLVAVMGSVAGSGGYYVATPASHIVAQPATVTGSIGVISAKIVNSRLLERLLLNRETIQRGQKDLFRYPEEPFTEEERQKAWAFIGYIYDLFIQRVAESRSLTPEDVDRVGAGRIWTGEQALEHGLVDELGGLETALKRLRSLANLHPNTPLIEMPYPKRDTAPLAPSTAWVDYALDSMMLINKNRALLAGPLFFLDINPWNNENTV